MGDKSRYRVGEFAKLTGISVRTLHHYDDTGLLKPVAHSEGGHRLYCDQDLLRLQQILTLRYLGFSLKQIEQLLERPDFNLVASLRIQQNAIRERITQLEHIESALRTMLKDHDVTGQWAWNLVSSASTALREGLSKKGNDMSDRFSPEHMKQFQDLGQKLGPDVIKEIENEWAALISDVRANLDADPASAGAQALSDRWNTLTSRTAEAYKNHPDLWKAIGENYQHDRFADIEQAPHAEDFAFIQRANDARSRPDRD